MYLYQPDNIMSKSILRLASFYTATLREKMQTTGYVSNPNKHINSAVDSENVLTGMYHLLAQCPDLNIQKPI